MTAVAAGAGPAARAPGRRPTLEVERRLWRAGHRWVAGIDEVGRGAWAGPLSVGVAVVHAGVRTRSLPHWLRDSKMLPEERRELVFDDVARWCADAAVGHATAEECDRYGMTRAWRLAAHRALGSLEVVPDALVIDGPYDFLRARVPQHVASDGDEADDNALLDVPTVRQGSFDLDDGADDGAADAAGESGGPGSLDDECELPFAPVPATVLTMVGGDARCAAVAAASVLAKVVRDRLMREESVHFPPYGFDRNKGYPSPHHQMALRGYGLSAIHRRSWAFVADLPWR
ncbi:MAG TPA: ribonuclease HII [Acidimicrobiales bacterium]|nr:ribonuclease HII [Acidimicrobiales bacterium]